MNGINRVLVAGHLGQDPECRATADGKWVANLSVATSRKRKDASGQTQEDTEWHRIVMWERNAELARQYLKKGAAIFVEGRLQTREWEDKEGRKRWSTEIVAERFQFLTSGRRDTEAEEDAPQSDSGPARQPKGHRAMPVDSLQRHRSDTPGRRHGPGFGLLDRPPRANAVLDALSQADERAGFRGACHA